MTLRTNLPSHVVSGLTFIEALDPASCEASVQALVEATLYAGAEISQQQVWYAYAKSHPGQAFKMLPEGTDERARFAIAEEERLHGIEPYRAPKCLLPGRVSY